MAKGDGIHIRLDESLEQRLKVWAKEDHRSLSNLIEMILMRWEQEQKPKAKALNGHAHKVAAKVAST